MNTKPQRGHITAWNVEQETGKRELLFEKPNLTMVYWGMIAAKCIGQGLTAYRLGAIYFEFENVASPGDAVSVPTYDEYDGVEYYTGLSSSPSQDFIRARLVGTPSLDIATGYEAYFSEGDGNSVSVYSQTLGTTGVHGKTFSNAVNSKVFGVALAATPVIADPTRDLIYARMYFEVADQVLKTASKQIGITWNVPFVLP